MDEKELAAHRQLWVRDVHVDQDGDHWELVLHYTGDDILGYTDRGVTVNNPANPTEVILYPWHQTVSISGHRRDPMILQLRGMTTLRSGSYDNGQ